MPLITTQRAGPCAACGLTIAKGEQAWHTQEGGTRHPEPTCATAPVRHRPNRRAGTCRCGTRVAAGVGHLVHLGTSGKGSTWAVRCVPPGPRC